MATDPIRDEAERLVAAAIAALSVASRTLGRGGRSGFATGSPECCVCPVCKAIAAMRDPNPEFAERLATGTADLAAGVAGLLRSLSRPAGGAGRRADAGPFEDERYEDEAYDDGPDPWHAATTEQSPPPKPMAKKAVKKAVKKAAPPPAPEPAEAPARKAAKKAPAKKAAKKAAPRKAPADGESA